MKPRYPMNPDEFREYFRYDFDCYEYDYPFTNFIDERTINEDEYEQMQKFYSDTEKFFLTN